MLTTTTSTTMTGCRWRWLVLVVVWAVAMPVGAAPVGAVPGGCDADGDGTAGGVVETVPAGSSPSVNTPVSAANTS